MSDELSQLEQHLLRELESRGNAQYRELCATTKESEGAVSQALSRLELLGKAHRKFAWWKLGPAPVVTDQPLSSGEKSHKKWTKKAQPFAETPKPLPPKPLAYRLLDLLEPGLEPEDETALLRVIKLAKMKQAEGII